MQLKNNFTKTNTPIPETNNSSPLKIGRANAPTGSRLVRLPTSPFSGAARDEVQDLKMNYRMVRSTRWAPTILINGVINPTPPKINMEHNNGGLEDDFPFQIGDF